MKLKYKFICKDINITNCDFIAYGNRKKDIIKRVQEYLIKNLGFTEEEVNHKEVRDKINEAIRKSQYARV